MSGPKPTLGYPTRTAAVVALLSQGETERTIASRIGIPVSSVAALRCSAERSREAGVATGRVRSVLIARDVLQKLGPHARRRGITRETLAALIVEAVAESNLVAAVLDDDEG